MHCLQIIKYLNGTPKYKKRIQALVSLQKIKEYNRGKNGRKNN